MKLATYRSGGAVRVGVVDADAGRLFDLSAAARRACCPGAPFASMLALIDLDDAGLDLARFSSRGAAARATCGPNSTGSNHSRPCRSRSRCGTRCRLRCTSARRRAAHARSRRCGPAAAMPSRPVMAEPLVELAAVYADIPISLHHQPLHRRRTGRDRHVAALQQSDGLRTRDRNRHARRAHANIPVKDAGAHIFGYTIFNDFSARDRQALEMQDASAQPRARVSTAEMQRGLRASSRRTSSAIRRR